MLYTELTKKALRVCFDAHKEQTDKAGAPYVFHPFHLAEQMTDEYTVAAALLHDTVEDTEITPEALAEMGFPKEVTDAVRLLTRPPETPYMDYIRTLRADPIARAVKRADLKHNADLSRLDAVTDNDLRRAEKYRLAAALLDESEPADEENRTDSACPSDKASTDEERPDSSQEDSGERTEGETEQE